MSFLLCDLENFFTRSAFLDSGIVELEKTSAPSKVILKEMKRFFKYGSSGTRGERGSEYFFQTQSQKILYRPIGKVLIKNGTHGTNNLSLTF